MGFQMANATVQKIEFNTTGPGRSGTYQGTTLYTISEGGATRIDFIFKSREQGDIGSIVESLSVGDKISLKIVKNGDYFNLSRDRDAIQLIEKCTNTVVTDNIFSKASTIPTGSYGSYKE